MWYFTWNLHSSCCSETHVRPHSFRSFYRLSTLDVTHVRKHTRPFLLYRTASNEKLGVGLVTRLGLARVYGICTLCAVLCIASGKPWYNYYMVNLKRAHILGTHPECPPESWRLALSLIKWQLHL